MTCRHHGRTHGLKRRFCGIVQGRPGRRCSGVHASGLHGGDGIDGLCVRPPAIRDIGIRDRVKRRRCNEQWRIDGNGKLPARLDPGISSDALKALIDDPFRVGIVAHGANSGGPAAADVQDSEGREDHRREQDRKYKEKRSLGHRSLRRAVTGGSRRMLACRSARWPQALMGRSTAPDSWFLPRS